MADELRTLITPAFLRHLVDGIIPYPYDTPVDFPKIAPTIINGEKKFPPDVKAQVWTVLVALSKLGLSNVPNLMTTLLPPLPSPEFPRLALGLQLLLDQMPRRHCRGVDKRYISGYFDVLSLQYAESLDALPLELKPHSWSRWKEAVTLDYFVIARIWFGTPYVHTDTVAIQERALAFSEETRCLVEQMTGTRDPYRDRREEILSDVYAFHRVLRAGPPKDERLSVQGYAYWMTMLMDVHKPIVDRFGHYPGRNPYLGKEDTAEEIEWFEKDGTPRAPAEFRERLKRDLELGVWKPLGAGIIED